MSDVVEDTSKKTWNGSNTDLVLIECDKMALHRFKGNMKRISYKLDVNVIDTTEELKEIIESVRVESLV